MEGVITFDFSGLKELEALRDIEIHDNQIKIRGWRADNVEIEYETDIHTAFEVGLMKQDLHKSLLY